MRQRWTSVNFPGLFNSEIISFIKLAGFKFVHNLVLDIYVATGRFFFLSCVSYPKTYELRSQMVEYAILATLPHCPWSLMIIIIIFFYRTCVRRMTLEVCRTGRVMFSRCNLKIRQQNWRRQEVYEKAMVMEEDLSICIGSWKFIFIFSLNKSISKQIYLRFHIICHISCSRV